MKYHRAEYILLISGIVKISNRSYASEIKRRGGYKMFIQKRFLMVVFLLVSSFIFWSITSPCIAQEKFPSRPITLLIGYPPGGAGDLPLRYLSESVSERLGQPVVILNKIGGEGQSRSAKSKPRNLMAIRLGICRVAQL